MRYFACFLTAVCFTCSVPAISQNSTVATVVKGEDLSNVPTAYQSKVKPGALLIVKGKKGETSFEPASAMAIGYNPSSDPVTVPDTDVNKVVNGELALSLFGFNPGAKLAKSGTLKYEQLNLTGKLITGDQMLDLLQKDPETMHHVDQWLLKGYHVYLVEGVFSTVELNASASNGLAVKLSSGQAIGACSATDTGGATTATATSIPGGAATLCSNSTSKAHFKTTAPTAIALKLDEVQLFPNPGGDRSKTHYDYVAARHVWGK